MQQICDAVNALLPSDRDCDRDRDRQSRVSFHGKEGKTEGREGSKSDDRHSCVSKTFAFLH